ncbi:MAG: hypothetical protein AAGG51_01925 [Cyanobacteria bacterium P01_G01_bin.54]
MNAILKLIHRVANQCLFACPVLAIAFLSPSTSALAPHSNTYSSEHSQVDPAAIRLAQDLNCAFPVYPDSEVRYFEHLDATLGLEERVNVYYINQSIADVFEYYQEQLDANSLCYKLVSEPVISEEKQVVMMDFDGIAIHREEHSVYPVILKFEEDAQWYLHIAQVDQEITALVLLPNALTNAELFNIQTIELDPTGVPEEVCPSQAQREDPSESACDLP